MTIHANQLFMALGLIGGAVAPTLGAVTSIEDPFLGEFYETFELIGAPGGIPGPVSIFDGHGTINDELAGSVIAATSLYSFISEEQILPWNGNFMGGCPTGWTVLEFDQGAHRFGGWIGTADVLEGGSVSFYDENDTLIETQDFNLPLNSWAWYGWESDDAFTKVVIHGATNPGLPMVFDDLQVAFVPAPSGAFFLALAGLTATRRRRA